MALSTPPRQRLWSPRRTRWLLNLYPPFLFNRVRVLEVAPDFTRARVRVSRSVLTRNLNGTTFGGSLFTAADPIHAVLYWQHLARRGLEVQTWLKAARIEYLKPAGSDVEYSAALGPEDLERGVAALAARGKFVHAHSIEMRDRVGDVCVRVEVEVYVRSLRGAARTLSGF